MRFKEFVTEVNMSPGALKDFVNSTAAKGMMAGFEAELIFRGAKGKETEEFENDQLIDRFITSDDIKSFFDADNYNTGFRRFENSLEEYIQEQVYDLIQTKNRNGSFHEEMIELMTDDGIDHDEAEQYMEETGRVFNDYMERWEEVQREEVFDDKTLVYYFLKGLGCIYMSDLVQEFGFEWPYWQEGGDDDFNVDSAKIIAHSMSRGIGGVKWKVSGEYHGTQRDNTTWILEPDGSVEPDEEEDMGIEIVTPPMPLLQALETLPKFLKWAKSEDAYTNDSTGFHMGVSLPDQNTARIDYIKLALFLGDHYVLNMFQRLGNSYTESSLSNLKSHMREISVEDLSNYMNQVRDKLYKDISNLVIKRLDQSRRVSINMKKNYIEFRSAGADYIDQVDKLVNTMMRYARAMAIAADPEAHKEEYQKKLYKLLTVKTQDAEDSDRLVKFRQVFFQAIQGWTPQGKTQAKQFLKDLQQNRDLPAPVPGELPVNPRQKDMFDKNIPRWSVTDGTRSISIRALDAASAVDYVSKNLGNVLNVNSLTARPLK